MVATESNQSQRAERASALVRRGMRAKTPHFPPVSHGRSPAAARFYTTNTFSILLPIAGFSSNNSRRFPPDMTSRMPPRYREAHDPPHKCGHVRAYLTFYWRKSGSPSSVERKKLIVSFVAAFRILRDQFFASGKSQITLQYLALTVL